MAFKKVTGIYEIVNLVNGKRYVGSAANIRTRWASHRHLLNSGRHHSVHLQRAWIKNGPDGFVFRELEVVALIADLIAREQHYLDTLRPEYNIARTAGSNLGVTQSAETRAKVGAASRRSWQNETVREMRLASMVGNWDDPDQREKVRQSGFRNWTNPDYLEKMAVRPTPSGPAFGASVKAGIAARKARGLPFGPKPGQGRGRVMSDEIKEKLRQANLGKKASDETRRKMSSSRIGKKRGPANLSPEGREAQRANGRRLAEMTNRGRVHSAETKEKIRQSLLGKKASDETRRKMSATRTGKKIPRRKLPSAG